MLQLPTIDSGDVDREMGGSYNADRGDFPTGRAVKNQTLLIESPRIIGSGLGDPCIDDSPTTSVSMAGVAKAAVQLHHPALYFSHSMDRLTLDVYIIASVLVGSLLIFAGGDIAYIDALVFAGGSSTGAGLNPIDLDRLTTWQQVCASLSMAPTNAPRSPSSFSAPRVMSSSSTRRLLSSDSTGFRNDLEILVCSKGYFVLMLSGTDKTNDCSTETAACIIRERD
jgi:hypothetical protein